MQHSGVWTARRAECDATSGSCCDTPDRWIEEQHDSVRQQQDTADRTAQAQSGEGGSLLSGVGWWVTEGCGHEDRAAVRARDRGDQGG